MSPRIDLEKVRIARPCPASWHDMRGDDRTRFCDLCSLLVHNVAEMTRDEAVDLIQNAEGKKICLRLLRRADGTVITRDCPVGVRTSHRRAIVSGGVAVSLALTANALWQNELNEGDAIVGELPVQPRTELVGDFVGDVAPPGGSVMIPDGLIE